MNNDKVGRTSIPRVRITRTLDEQVSNGESREDASESEYTVGYKRPPVHSQFKPGVSGNPRGRRKGYSNIKEEIQQVYLRKLTVQDGLKKQRIPKIVLLYNAILNEGLKGNKAAVLLAAKMAERFGVYDVQDKPVPDLSMLTKEEREQCSRALTILRNARARSPKFEMDI